ncbi:hypothetical protein, partial [Bacteroides sp.]
IEGGLLSVLFFIQLVNSVAFQAIYIEAVFLHSVLRGGRGRLLLFFLLHLHFLKLFCLTIKHFL